MDEGKARAGKLQIDKSLLANVGLAQLPQEEVDPLLRYVYETLERRVGVELADLMSDTQLEEFERYFQAKDDAGAFRWLQTNFPNYREIVRRQYDALVSELRENAPLLLGLSGGDS
ncbi:MAG TPA: DUF5663 domain-containing protein [Thermoleophilaceae bacterium]